MATENISRFKNRAINGAASPGFWSLDLKLSKPDNSLWLPGVPGRQPDNANRQAVKLRRTARSGVSELTAWVSWQGSSNYWYITEDGACIALGTMSV